MKKITIELSDDDVEEAMSLLHRAVETLDRLEAVVEDLQELREQQNANRVQRRRPSVSNKR
jgi:hypothetical protein